MPADVIGDYSYTSTKPAHTQAYLLGPLRQALAAVPWPAGGPKRVFELGCGNGANAHALTADGYEVVGVDPSADGIRIANAAYPNIKLDVGSAYDDLAAKYGRFHALYSLEVVEHVFYPRKYARCVADLLEPGGTAILSTPYHGYLKNLAMALTGKMDKHFTALWDYGHIKFWSPRTLTILLAEAGLTVTQVIRVGRIPPLAKSMVVIARKTGGPTPAPEGTARP